MEDDTSIRIVAVPYDSGHHGLRMGGGPDAEFTTISYWSSMEAMEAAHGESLIPTHLEKDEEYLLELPESVEVSELHVNDWQLNTLS